MPEAAARGPSAGPIQVLLVDDEEAFTDSLAKVLRRRGLQVTVAASGEAGIAHLAEHDCDVVVLDLRMPGLDGLATLGRLKELRPTTQVIMLTGHGTVEAGIEALRLAAFDFMLKPAATERLVEVICAAGDLRARAKDAR
jgi:DNA-binding NtrC family response regulator